MTDNQETSADIIAEMRRRIAVKMSDAWYTQEEWRKLCDRLEAAHRRESAFHAMTCEANERLREHLQIALDADGRERGDCAKLREALEHMVRAETDGSMERDDLCGRCLNKMFARCNHDGTCWVDKAIAALAATEKEGGKDGR